MGGCVRVVDTELCAPVLVLCTVCVCVNPETKSLIPENESAMCENAKASSYRMCSHVECVLM